MSVSNRTERKYCLLHGLKSGRTVSIFTVAMIEKEHNGISKKTRGNDSIKNKRHAKSNINKIEIHVVVVLDSRRIAPPKHRRR